MELSWRGVGSDAADASGLLATTVDQVRTEVTGHDVLGRVVEVQTTVGSTPDDVAARDGEVREAMARLEALGEIYKLAT